MPDCQQFEIAIDQRLRNALPEDEAIALEAHCAACKACTEYEEEARRMQLGLHALANQAREAVDWDHLEQRIHARLRARMRNLFIGMGIAAAAVALTTWGFAPPDEAVVFAGEVGALVGAVVLARGLFVVREVRQLSRLGHGDELIARHRSMLGKQMRTLRQYRWVALAVVLWCISNAMRSVEVRQVVVHAGLACFVASTWLYALLVVYPRLKREVTELGPKGPR